MSEANADFPLIHVEEFTVATVPTAANFKNRIIRVTNGAAGSNCLAISDGTNWKQIAVGANIAAA